MLQLLHMNVVKVDRDVAHVAYFCKCFQCYVARVLKNVFRPMLQLVFYQYVAYIYTHVASVLFGCCICFTHILQVFYLDVAYVSHICCDSMFQMFHYVRHMLHPSVSRRHGE
jgi:hypothetical protein